MLHFIYNINQLFEDCSYIIHHIMINNNDAMMITNDRMKYILEATIKIGRNFPMCIIIIKIKKLLKSLYMNVFRKFQYVYLKKKSYFY